MDAPTVATDAAASPRPAGPDGGGGRPVTEEFLLQEYGAYREALNENERAGEGRVNLFLTITTAVLGALALKGDLVRAGDDFDALFLLLVVLLFGITTLARMLHRKRVAHQMRRALSNLRAYFVDPASPVAAYPEWQPREPVEPPTMKPLAFVFPGNGGLVDATALLNCAVAGALVTLVAVRLGGTALSGWGAWGAAVAGFLAAWAAQVVWVRRVYAGLAEPGGKRP